MTRVLLFTGKGGVGKTSIAAATAVASAAAGQRVLVLSTDPAHSLADALDHPVSDQPVTIASRLAAQQIDVQRRIERHWDAVRDYLVELLAWGGVGEVAAEELVVLPGLDELFALLDLRTHVQAGEHDLVVVDCAPTAETLRLLALPDALRWYVERILVPGRRMARALRPMTSRVGGVPVPEDRVFEAVQRLQRELAEVHALLQDPARSSVRLVLTPERVVISETLRTATSMGLFGYAVDAVVVNRILPDVIADPYLRRWQERHAEHLTTVEREFAPTPVLRAPLLPDEPVGVAGLGALADGLYAGRDATAVLHRHDPLRIEPHEGGYVLRLALPFAGRDDVDLHRRGDALHVRVGSNKRTVPLPAALRRCEVAGARLTEGDLRVRFTAAAPAEAPR